MFESRSGLRRHRLRKHLKQEIQFNKPNSGLDLVVRKPKIQKVKEKKKKKKIKVENISPTKMVATGSYVLIF
jgi:hypothetical protein